MTRRDPRRHAATGPHARARVDRHAAAVEPASSAGVVLYPVQACSRPGCRSSCSHGVAMVLTGAGFDRVLIYRDTSGLAYAQGPAAGGAVGASFIATAGCWAGTPLWGAALLVLTPNVPGVRRIALPDLRRDAARSQRSPSSATASARTPIAGRSAAQGEQARFPPPWRCPRRGRPLHQVGRRIEALLDIRVLFRTSQVINGQELACTDQIKTGQFDVGTRASYTFGTTTTGRRGRGGDLVGVAFRRSVVRQCCASWRGGLARSEAARLARGRVDAEQVVVERWRSRCQRRWA